VEGYIVDHRKDTIRGFILSSREQAYHKECIFTDSVITTRFQANDVQGFGLLSYSFSDRTFVRTFDREYFAELVEEGSLSLYQVSPRLFYINKGEMSVRIENERISIVDGKGQKVLRRSTIWRPKLKYLTKDCLEDTNYEMLDFSRKNIVKIVKAYNRCVDQ